jgi:hypothetical protein
MASVDLHTALVQALPGWTIEVSGLHHEADESEGDPERWHWHAHAILDTVRLAHAHEDSRDGALLALFNNLRKGRLSKDEHAALERIHSRLKLTRAYAKEGG